MRRTNRYILRYFFIMILRKVFLIISYNFDFTIVFFIFNSIILIENYIIDGSLCLVLYIFIRVLFI